VDCPERFLDANEVGEAVSEDRWQMVSGGGWVNFGGLVGLGEALVGSLLGFVGFGLFDCLEF
jgi:hypothetical protein